VDENEAYWLGWMCVHSDYIGKGFGSKLISFAVKKAKKDGKKFLRLYTSEDPAQAKAQKVYEKKGFRITRREIIKGEKYKRIYRELRL
tara:strand:+ start:4939 stop:5202 length:264 start_codon:yes stop_codon:yes gene_type:complete